MPGLRSLAPSPCATAAAIAATLIAAGCGPKHRLSEYDFRGRTIAVATVAPAHPAIQTGSSLDVDPDNPIATLVRAGSEIVREAEADRLRARLDSAAADVDVSGRMARRVLENAARQLRATPVEDGRGADFELEVRIEEYGIVASSWSEGAYFRVEGDVLLLDGKTGRIVWDTHVWARDPVTLSNVDANETAVSNVVTAIALARMSAEEIRRAFETLADYAADAVLRQFTEDLDEARRR